MIKTKLASLTLLVSLLFSSTAALAANPYMTHGETAEILANAADDYNSGVTTSDIIKGYEDGSLRENESVTRAEFLVMLDRAFGGLPTPSGHNARVAIPAEEFTDVPEWAKTELSDVFDAGIIAGTGDGRFLPDEPVTKDQAELFIERVYSLFGTNLKDDFYASVNKDALESMEPLPGLTMGGTLYDLNEKATGQIKEIIEEITSTEHEYGTPEQKLSDMYKSMTAVGKDDNVGTELLNKYLDMIDGAGTAAELIKVNAELSEEICFAPLMDFSVVTDMKDSTKHVASFDVPETSFTKEFYEDSNSAQMQIFTEHMSKLFIAHEITHAFDNNGAKFDENGNAADWWAPEDYNTFNDLCADMIAFYDGCEGIPGIPMNGTLTLSENIADQGAVQCITEIESRRESPDFKTLYTSFAKCMAATTTRAYAQYAATFDYHSDAKLRVNRTVVNCPEFYEAFGITENDGMWVAPENRVRVW